MFHHHRSQRQSFLHILGCSEDFIEEIENFKENRVYSLRQLNLIANYFNMRISEIFPENSITDDLLELEIELIKIAPTAVQIDKYGDIIKNYRIVSGRIITQQKNSLNYFD